VWLSRYIKKGFQPLIKKDFDTKPKCTTVENPQEAKCTAGLYKVEYIFGPKAPIDLGMPNPYWGWR
jgi:hypothetical protein